MIPDAAEVASPATTSTPTDGAADNPPQQTQAAPPPSAETTEESPETTATEAAAPAEKASEKPDSVEIELDGEKKTVKLADLAEAYSLLEKSQAELRDVEEYRAEVNGVLQRFLDDPATSLYDAFVAVHKDEEKAADLLVKAFEPFMAEWWKFKQMSDAEKQGIRTRRELEREKKTRAALEQKLKKQDEESLETKEARGILREVPQALKETGLPSSPRLQRLVAETIYITRKEGYELTAKRAAELVRDELRKEGDERLKEAEALGPEAILGLFPTVAKHIREADAAAVKRAQSRPPPKTNGVQRPAEEAPTQRVFRDYDELYTAPRK